jgi:hypothetical protein
MSPPEQLQNITAFPYLFVRLLCSYFLVKTDASKILTVQCLEGFVLWKISPTSLLKVNVAIYAKIKIFVTQAVRT